MAKCPKCGIKINQLKGYEQCGYNLEIVNGEPKDGEHSYMEDSFQAECPHCSEILFTNYNEAIKFLRGE